MRMNSISLGLAVAAALFGWQFPTQAQVVPGSGQQILEVGDDFEDASWAYTYHLPKASSNIDKVDRQPAGYSSNGMWLESLYRGTPDFVKRVETPEGGIPGSKGALALQTLYSGIPGQLSGKFQQDDLIANVNQKLGYMLPAAWTPSYVVRIYVPAFDKWENRVGSSFGFRADCQTMINKPTKVSKLFRTGGTTREAEQYWPGFFFQFNGKTHPQHTDKNTATILIRSGEQGQDIPGPTIVREGWWTLGMTITPDGRVHYYGHEGVENLTAKDHLYSNFPYGYRCLQTSTFFFNVVNQDDGRSWSTRWIVDDPKVFVATGSYVPRQPARTAQAPVQPISLTTPIPATTPAAQPNSAAPTPAAVPNATPTPILQSTPQSVTPAPAVSPMPVEQTSAKLKTNAELLAPLLSPSTSPSVRTPSPGGSVLPPLLRQPTLTTPTTSLSLSLPVIAPALLPELSAAQTPAIQLPVAAPRALPVDDSTPLTPASQPAPLTLED